jgi:hypothetical protein
MASSQRDDPELGIPRHVEYEKIARRSSVTLSFDLRAGGSATAGPGAREEPHRHGSTDEE